MKGRILLWQLIFSTYPAFADWNCKFTVPNVGDYDLSGLAGQHTVERTRSTPPTSMIDRIIFNVCNELDQSQTPESERCPAGTWACLTKTNKKEGSDDRVISVIPLATKDKLTPTYVPIPHGISLLLHGDSYTDVSGKDIPQILDLNLLCSKGEQVEHEPTFKSYNESTAVIEWSSSSACALGEDDSNNPPSPPTETTGNGLGWFFLLFFLSLGAYFGVGIYYNYSTYGASGWDLIPHRDFWRDVPNLLSDLFHHLLSSIRSGPSRGGYHSV